VSKKNRKFKAFLVKTPQGKVGFEFLPRAEKPAKAAPNEPTAEAAPAPKKIEKATPAKKTAGKKKKAG
jgi:DNA topoisomerase-3